jgi:hypothetical protein
MPTQTTPSSPIEKNRKVNLDFINPPDQEGRVSICLNGRIEIKIELRDYDMVTRKYGKPIGRTFPFMPMNPAEIGIIRRVIVTPRSNYLEISFRDQDDRSVMQPLKLAYPERNQRYI